MLVVLQFPIADLRLLARHRPPIRLPRVQGRALENGVVDSFRYFGWASRRQAGADQAFPDETYLYSAHNALHFLALGARAFAKTGTEVAPRISSFRRVFLSRQAMAARVEIGLGLTTRQVPIQFDPLIRMLETVLTLRTAIRTNGPGYPGASAPGKVERDGVANDPGAAAAAPRRQQEREDGFHNAPGLSLQGKALARHFAMATSSEKIDDLRLAAKLVKSCQPPILIAQLRHGEFIPQELSRNLPYFRCLEREHTGGADVWFGQLAKRTIPTWILAPGRAPIETVRSLRLCLLRLHSEHRVLEEVLEWMDGDPAPDTDPEALCGYLKYQREKIFYRARRASLDNSAILEAIAAATAVKPEAEAIFLKQRLDGAYERACGGVPRGTEPQRPDVTWKAWLETLERPPDLTVVIQQQQGSSDLLWSFFSPHAAVLAPAEPVPCDRGRQPPQDFPRQVLNVITVGGDGLYNNLRGIGSGLIGKATPRELWRLLREVGEAVKPRRQRPTVLILSDESHIPWELARSDDEDAPFLAAAAVVSRWILPSARNPNVPRPPLQIRIDSAAFFSGHYGGTGFLKDLPEAREEVEKIAAELGGKTPPVHVDRIEAAEKEMLTYLRGKPSARLLHFAMHGKFDPEYVEDGLLMTSGKPLFAFGILDFKLRGNPFVFLNACEVGQGNEVLGSCTGLPECFVKAGASAVVAPMWAIDDPDAHRLAVAFYQATLLQAGGSAGEGPSTVAEQLRTERARFDQPSVSPTCLAYKFFGHPELRLALGDSPVRSA